MSITQLCAHGCKALFTNTVITITLHDTVILSGTQDQIPHSLNATITGSVNAMFHTTLAHDTIASMIAFYHASCYWPALSTRCATVDAGQFTTRPGLTAAAVRKYPPAFMVMHQGHLDLVRMNTRTTQSLSPLLPTTVTYDENTQQQATDAEAALDIAPPQPPSRQTQHLYTDCNVTTGEKNSNTKCLLPSIHAHHLRVRRKLHPPRAHDRSHRPINHCRIQKNSPIF
jgi:hypothetical protein